MYLSLQLQMTSSWCDTSRMSVSPVTTCDPGHIQDHTQDHMLTFCAWDCTSSAIIACQHLTSRILYWTWIDGWWEDGGRILLTSDWHCRCLRFKPCHSYHLHPHLNLNVNLGPSNSATISIDSQILHLISINRDAVLGGNVKLPLLLRIHNRLFTLMIGGFDNKTPGCQYYHINSHCKRKSSINVQLEILVTLLEASHCWPSLQVSCQTIYSGRLWGNS
jgi:hypothetical protein